MPKLIKYELRKTQFSKIVLFTITLFFEILFLMGTYGNRSHFLATGLMSLICCAVFGLVYIGIAAVFVRDEGILPTSNQSLLI